MDEVVTSEKQAGQRFLVNSLMEEAIRSSQLEGATTSRRVAKEMLRTGREPRDRGERMIANNYRALQFMREEMGEQARPRTPSWSCTESSPKGPSTTPRPRVACSGQGRNGWRSSTATTTNSRSTCPRQPSSCPSGCVMLCDFANEDGDGDRFIHPVVRAILAALLARHTTIRSRTATAERRESSSRG